MVGKAKRAVSCPLQMVPEKRAEGSQGQAVQRARAGMGTVVGMPVEFKVSGLMFLTVPPGGLEFCPVLGVPFLSPWSWRAGPVDTAGSL